MLQFKNIFNKISSKETKLSYFKTLDELPFYNWLHIHKEKKLVYLIKNIEYSIFTLDPKLNTILETIWSSIYDEYMIQFGLNKKYKRVLEIERKLAILKCDLWINDNKFLRNQIRIQEKLLEREIKNTIDDDGNDHTKQVILIEKWLNSSIDIKKISAKKYFLYLEIIQDEANKMKLKETKNG